MIETIRRLSCWPEAKETIGSIGGGFICFAGACNNLP